MHAFLAADGCEATLLEELRRAHPGFHQAQTSGLIQSEFDADWNQSLPPLVFLRQALFHAVPLTVDSIRLAAETVFDRLVQELPESQPWRFHCIAHYGARNPGSPGARARFTQARFRRTPDTSAAEANKTADAGQHRCQLIEQALVELLQRKRRHLRRQRVDSTEPFSAAESFVQLLLTSPTQGLLSIHLAPGPSRQPRWVVPFQKGDIPIAVDKAAPSRAFAKLVESEIRMGRKIQAGEFCVDLGAAPGSWSYLALQRGARVTAVDRAHLRDDLMDHPNLEFVQGDAFNYLPSRMVDWLLCDVIAAPERCAQLVMDWIRQKRCRRFVVTIKFSGAADLNAIQNLKRELAEVCPEFFLQRLCANKNEACVFGAIV